MKHTRGELVEPHWSPDGRKILYVQNEPNGRSIWTMNVSGSQRQRLVLVRSDQPDSYSVNGVGWRPG